MFHLPFLKRKYKQLENTKTIEFINLPKNMNSIKSVAIFGCFSSDGQISPLQKFYLKELEKIADAIVVIYDNHLFDIDIKKLSKKIIYFKAERHNEYDFGSYKRGYEFLVKYNLIASLNNLLLTNDSSYGPIFSLKETFNKMNGKADFWGMIQNDKYQTHIQSWFINFESNVIKSNLIYAFLKNVKKHKLQQTYVLKYETKLTRFLVDHGFKYDTYIPANLKIKKFMTNGDICFFSEKLIKEYRIPFMKKKLFNPYFYHIVDERKGALLEIKKINPILFKLIIDELKQKNYDLSFLN